ncbi:MAG: helix-turn-helix transcriptional regulator [Phycisphaerae bacterium]|nr:helix-turn-helix transcriptional regulator [Phycisphaerae bacterium]
MAMFDWASESAELVVLSLLGDGPGYGYSISKEIAARSGGTLKLAPGSLYPLLNGMEAEGLIASSWEEIKSERAAPDAEGRRRKWYRLTSKGRRRLDQRVASHRAFRGVIDAFIGGRKIGDERTPR